MKSPIILLRSLLIDFGRLDPCVKGLDRDIITIGKRFKHEGYGFLSIALPILGDAITNGLSTGRFCCPKNFKEVPRGSIPRFLSGMISEVFDTKTGLLKLDPPIGVITSLRQLCFMFKKTHLSSESSDKLHKEACDGFFSNDTIAQKVVLPIEKEYRLGLVCRLVLPHLSSKDAADLDYKHGPGAVMEGLKGNQKWLAVTKSILQDAFRTDHYGYDQFGILLRDSLSESLGPNDCYTDLQSIPDSVSSSSARLISVPKNSSSNRTITVEPMLNQFIQQGLNIHLRDSISKCNVLRLCLALTDQSRNQRLALIGSRNDKYATLDLKSASDLLSFQLFKSVFRWHPNFIRDAVSCRSKGVKLESFESQLSKFAGMGNALTFPVQSIVFAVLSIAAIIESRNESVTYGNVQRAARCIQVYGDDIIVKTEYAHAVVAWLHDYGLIVNVKKSFLTGNFKESCGVDAFRGNNVTPIYLRQRPDNPSTEASDIAGLVSTCNQLWLKGYYKTSDCLREEIEGRLGYSLPLVSSKSGSLGWHTRLDASHATKWCKKLQMLLVKAPVVTPIHRKDKLDGIAALLKFFHVPLLGRPVRHLLQSPVRFKLRIVRKWVPARAG